MHALEPAYALLTPRLLQYAMYRTHTHTHTHTQRQWHISPVYTCPFTPPPPPSATLTPKLEVSEKQWKCGPALQNEQFKHQICSKRWTEKPVLVQKSFWQWQQLILCIANVRWTYPVPPWDVRLYQESSTGNVISEVLMCSQTVSCVLALVCIIFPMPIKTPPKAYKSMLH